MPTKRDQSTKTKVSSCGVVIASLRLVALASLDVTAFAPGTVLIRLDRTVVDSRDRQGNSSRRFLVQNFFEHADDGEDLPLSGPMMQPRKLGAGGTAPKYIRIRPRTVRGSRQTFEVQTAVTAFERRTKDGQEQTVELHSQLHFGTQAYFDYYNSKEFASQYDRVHYELLIDKDLMVRRDGLRYLPAHGDGDRALMASLTDANTASRYGLTCQVDVMDYTQPNWIHADLTRQELLQEAENERTGSAMQLGNRPLWALASTSPTWPGAEAISALFRPSTPSTPLSSPVTRRLFSNLFLPGNALAGLLRALFWVTVPSPELSVMVLDWSSILPRPTGGLSLVALPILECLLTGNLQEARQLVFGQMVVGGQSTSGKEESLLVEKRNDHALEVLGRSLGKDGCSSNALLYGGMHCRDLHQKLKGMGFVPTKTLWRTAWSVNVPSFGTGSSQMGVMENFAAAASPTAIAVGLVILPLYFFVGGCDWIATLRDLAASIDSGQWVHAALESTLYLVRHVLLYFGLAKFVVEWDGGFSLFGSDNW